MLPSRRPFLPALVVGTAFLAGLALGLLGRRVTRASGPASAATPAASGASGAGSAALSMSGGSPSRGPVAGGVAGSSGSAAGGVAGSSGPAIGAASGAESGPAGVEGLAESGDLGAIKAIEAIEDRQRTAAQSLALARGRVVLARGDVAALLGAVERQPELAHDRATLARFYDLAEREPVAVEALGAVAKIPGPEGADLLHAAWRRHRHTITGLLARDLLRSEECRARASEALLLTIELEELMEMRPIPTGSRAERRCGAVRALLGKIAEAGDARSKALFPELNSRQGCGLGKEDCYPCLREDDSLARAKEAVEKREAPTPWVLRR